MVAAQRTSSALKLNPHVHAVFLDGVYRDKKEDDMKKNGARPTWLFYVGVDDVDATAKKVEAAGGTLLMQPFDIPGAGRAAMIADPQGIPFYVMRGSTDGTSTVFERTGMGKCNWNELATPDQASANKFYETLFGWTYPDKMPIHRRGGGEGEGGRRPGACRADGRAGRRSRDRRERSRGRTLRHRRAWQGDLS